MRSDLLHADFRRRCRLSLFTALKSLPVWPWLVLALALLDALWPLPDGLRRALAFAFLGAFLIWLGFLAVKALRRTASEAEIALDIERRHGALGSALSNTLDLEKQLNAGCLRPRSQGLAKSALEDYRKRVAGFDLGRALLPPAPVRSLQRAGFALAIALTLAAIFHSQVAHQCRRYLSSSAEVPPLSDIILTLKAPSSVLYGSPLLVEVMAEGRDPGEVQITWRNADGKSEPVTLPLFRKAEGSYAVQIASVRSDLVLQAHTPDGRSLSTKVPVKVILTPRFENAELTIKYPEYTGLPPRSSPWPYSDIKVLSGSTLDFVIHSNRPLASGSLAILDPFGGAPELSPMKADKSAPASVAASLLANRNMRLQLSLVDTAGNPSSENREFAVAITEDKEPSLDFVTPDKDSFIADDHSFTLKVRASDDYGIASIRLHTSVNGKDPQKYPYAIAAKPPQLSAVAELPISIRKLGLKEGDTLTLQAETVDNCPSPHLVLSRIITLTVVSKEDYNEYLRQTTSFDMVIEKYSQVAGKMHDLAELQKQLAKDIAEHQADPKKHSDTNLLKRQAELAARTQDLAKDLRALNRDKPLYDIEKEVGKELEELAAELEKAAQEAQEAADKAAAGAKPTPRALQDLAKAAEKLAEKLGGGAQEAQEELVPALEEVALMEALVRDFNLIEELTRKQAQLAAATRRFDNPRQLDAQDRLALSRLSKEQKRVADLLATIPDSLRANAELAQDVFPKAAESALEMAERLDELALHELGDEAATALLTYQGQAAAELTESLHQQLLSLFEKGQNCEGACQANNNEFDQHLRLLRQLKPGKTFSQLCKGRKGKGKPGQGQGQGSGSGQGEGEGSSAQPGYNAGSGEFGLMGSESLSKRRHDGKAAAAKGELSSASAQLNPGGNSSDTKLANAEASPTGSDAPLNEFRAAADAYFKKVGGSTETPKALPKNN
ncbi:MAG: hypothetical protein RL095_3089 [Verrucomicrobiota bacterium]|jgi:hypothetical protein